MINSEKVFLSCDWGTTSFRLRLVDAAELTVLAEESNDEGNLSSFERWKQSDKPEEERVEFYQQILLNAIKKLEDRLGASLKDVPLIISGMASSSIGMLELPYKQLPFAADGADLQIHAIDKSSEFNHPTFIVSGVKSADDVMRGEEMQLVGCDVELNSADQVYIFPGTHSKHVIVRDGKAVVFNTYLTGELFNLLATKSILANSIESGGKFNDANNLRSFQNGVVDSLAINPLHAFFLVRTNMLFDKMTGQENYFYLSGLVIGTELKDLLNREFDKVVLVSNKAMRPYYETALQSLKISKELACKDIDEAILNGHAHIYGLKKLAY
jgi:2-dehydro-3-deoxygalactonokinase